MLSERDVQVLETAEWLEGRRVDGPSLVRARTGLQVARFWQVLYHLIQQDEVLADPRWTMLAHRLGVEMGIRDEMRQARTFDRGTVIPLRRAS